MPTSSSATSKPTAKSRSLSACEISRSVRYFDRWCLIQDCEQVAFSDLPSDLRLDAENVFDLRRRLPLSWVQDSSHPSSELSSLPKELFFLLRDTHTEHPEIFTDAISSTDSQLLLPGIVSVFNAWTTLRKMRASGLSYSETDFAAQVYNVFRAPAVRESLFRSQCSIALPSPQHADRKQETQKVMTARVSIPDGTVFIQPSSIRSLSHTLKSSWKVLNSHLGRADTKGKAAANSGKRTSTKTLQPKTMRTSSSQSHLSFRYQSTPCSKAPDVPGFEFASSFWEDKKTSHDALEQAIRQNRISTTASVRHLHSFDINVPVFGLIWANGRVCAHVDWWDRTSAANKDSVRVLSAPYTMKDGALHEWNLEEPADIIRVFLLIRNIDIWTHGVFKDRIVTGVESFTKRVTKGAVHYEPWRQPDALTSSNEKENLPPNTKKTRQASR